MFGVDPDIGSSAMRLWVAAGSAALLVFVCALALDWTRTRTVARVSVVVVGAILGATLAWTFLDGASVRDLGAERRTLEMRAAELNGQTLAPGSSLACLDGLAGDGVEAACERALFASPASVASATSYAAARLALLADVAAYTRRGGANIDTVLLPLRRSLEIDRFGFVAHMLAVRDACTSDNCKVLALLHDPSHVRANLSGQTLDRYLDHYQTVWMQMPDVPLADAAPSAATQTATAGQPAPPGQRKVTLDIDFPSAASIPPVSIMNPEPKGPVGTTAAASVAAGAASAETNAAAAPPSSNKPARKQSGKTTAAPVAAAAPTAPAAAAAPVDPVWGPATVPAPPRAAVSSTVGAPPVQLSPSSEPQASAGGAARTQ
jgi:hypothetical protein